MAVVSMVPMLGVAPVFRVSSLGLPYLGGERIAAVTVVISLGVGVVVHRYLPVLGSSLCLLTYHTPLGYIDVKRGTREEA